jgi:hypothetical protein
MVSSDLVFSEQCVVFATDSLADLTLLSSSFHQLWASTYSSTMGVGAGVRYSPRDAFETMPRPEATETMAGIGIDLDEERREMMLRRKIGLTSLYNLVNDPKIQEDADVARLREIHVELDEATMAAYGWDDVPLDHGYHTYRQMERWTVSPAARVEILDRLLELNHERARAEGQDVPEQEGLF